MPGEGVYITSRPSRVRLKVMLTQSPTVPHIQTGEVIGVCGGKVWPMLPDGAECAHLWIAGAGIVGVQLDLAGVRALIDLLGEIAEKMGEGGN